MDIRIGAYAVITDQAGRMLLPHWHAPDAGGWTLPGGGIEPGEDPADAAVREVFEETGYTCELEALLGVDNMVVPGEMRLAHSNRQGIPLQNLRIIYRAHIVSGELTVEQDGSTNDVGWFTPAQIDELKRVSLVNVARRMAGLID